MTGVQEMEGRDDFVLPRWNVENREHVGEMSATNLPCSRHQVASAGGRVVLIGRKLMDSKRLRAKIR
jgi:hypothetical protein